MKPFLSLLVLFVTLAGCVSPPPPPPILDTGPTEQDIAQTIAKIDEITQLGEGIATNDHDAFVILTQVGYKNAVPVLINSLRLVESVDVDGQQAYVCTWVHLLEALRLQTGKDFGLDQSAWQAWWDTEGKNLPESHFAPAKHQRPRPDTVIEPTDTEDPGLPSQ